MDWQPIETAPRDGTSLLFYVPGVNSWNRPDGIADMVVGLWRETITGGTWRSDMGDVDQGYESTGAYFVYEDFSPTHWMPLPAPPIFLHAPHLPSSPNQEGKDNEGRLGSKQGRTDAMESVQHPCAKGRI